MTDPLLTVDAVEVRYGAALALAGLSLTVAEGSVLAVVGPNGAGKSSLARVLGGLVRPTAGTIRFAGRDVTGWGAHRARQAGLVHLPEGRGVFTGLTVAENLRMAAAIVPRSERADAVGRAYTLFPVLAERRRQLAGSLSGGEQQMISLARGLIVSPRVLVADEMSLGLAPKMVDVVFEGLSEARGAGVTIVLIEQYVHRALAFADHCVVLHRGAAAWSGPVAEATDDVLARFLGTSAA
ncbi:ABC transporter ATP-binding protein [Cryptosporangium aurantiacum]|uniref:Amino acid/amide ABC transporter ATP-binding protein 2, HAAT family n=1 Tax=Cryptosporangium aurantiacum TaxID=134849 RepID=A0A1M7PIF2_9ACTN|nr:ABC transporter ATP-binding protein [Cryptosporangium aurantiacum]SHN16729.1 amino acid/amide ABC transporter ATP-binding protein 2, HAAT family [Cryptosporangium aurantiacum]